ncbi:hypothetical protein BdWA1_000080 [Babesia duncani]|uniref:Uncharacterized protein n=1 Tax=Babesia duncani TaxID=323732 RepID=A0AAD9PMF6_9APIC|nr:hypothetical protein BdWA1_000080 [Babesia duncani]
MDPGGFMKAKFIPGQMTREQVAFTASIKASMLKSHADGFRGIPGGNVWPQQMWPQGGPKAPNYLMYQMPMMQQRPMMPPQPQMIPQQMVQHPQMQQQQHPGQMQQHPSQVPQMRMQPPPHMMPGPQEKMAQHQIYQMQQQQLPMHPHPMHAMPQPQYHQQMQMKRPIHPKFKLQQHMQFKMGPMHVKMPLQQPPMYQKQTQYRQMSPMLPTKAPMFLQHPKASPGPMMPMGKQEAFVPQPLGPLKERTPLGPNFTIQIKDALIPEESRAQETQEPPEPLEVQMERQMIKLMKSQAQKARDLFGFDFEYTDEKLVARVLIDEFIPLLQILWQTTRDIHRYSLDGTLLALSDGKCKGIQIERDYTSLQDYYKLKMHLSDIVPRRSLHIPAPAVEAPTPQDIQATTFTKAKEYAEVSYNQRHLLQKVTALDYRSALLEDRIRMVMPEQFRLKQIEMATTLHFDLGTPPQCVSPPVETNDAFAAESILYRCYTNLQNTGLVQVPNSPRQDSPSPSPKASKFKSPMQPMHMPHNMGGPLYKAPV